MIMERVERMLNGRTEELIRSLREEMEIASDALEFEQAGMIRDSIVALEKYNQKMKVVADKAGNRDLFALAVDREIREACGVLLKSREGKLSGEVRGTLKKIGGTSSREW